MFNFVENILSKEREKNPQPLVSSLMMMMMMR